MFYENVSLSLQSVLTYNGISEPTQTVFFRFQSNHRVANFFFFPHFMLEKKIRDIQGSGSGYPTNEMNLDLLNEIKVTLLYLQTAKTLVKWLSSLYCTSTVFSSRIFLFPNGIFLFPTEFFYFQRIFLFPTEFFYFQTEFFYFQRFFIFPRFFTSKCVSD